jgi:hypothetical protein
MSCGDYGPWSRNIMPEERVAQLRSIAALTAAAFGSDHPVVSQLRRAEAGGAALQEALTAFETLPALSKRRILSVFNSVNYWREPMSGNVA